MIRRIDLDQRRFRSRNDFDRWGQGSLGRPYRLRASPARFSVHQLKAAIRQLRKAWWPKRPKPTRRNGTWLSASIATLFADFPSRLPPRPRAIFMFGVAARRMSFRRLRRGAARIWTGS